ncbi:MAG: hypothetical protein HQ519_01090 [Planctomycetes bacterium]|nr:hypothetical protein [Planctomycetota bacterium]
MDPILEHIAEAFARIEIRGRDAINPLHNFVIVAEEFSRYFQEHVLQVTEDEVDRALFWGWGKPLSEGSGARLSPSKTIEEAGILGLYKLLHSEGDQLFVYGNDLSRIVHGIDAISQNAETGALLLWEVKGTTRPISGGFRTYLRNTKTLGRQLSWQWCWNRLILLACHTTSSEVFLKMVKPFIKGKVERRLVVSFAEKMGNGYVPIGRYKVWTEPDFSTAEEMKDTHNRKEQEYWLMELEASGVQLPHKGV